MYLKTLTLKGFKSFADTTALELEPGVTVVVGPERLGQVERRRRHRLGARRPGPERGALPEDGRRHLRRHRQALGARAGPRSSLTIDNSDGMVPIEFNEVTITRTLFRTGDSEYAINNVPCRLLDIQELLSDAGVGRQQHVIISQGQIDAVLNAKPEERRLDHRGGGRRPEVPQAQGEVRAPARRPPRPTSPASRTCCARCAASSARSSARPTPPAATARSWPS